MKKTIILFLVFSFSFFTHLSAQIISTYAGNGYDAGLGSGGYSGDGGPAIDAEFYFPEDVIFDKYGNMYIDDSGNNRIREISAFTGIVNTIAGGGTGLGLGSGGPATDAILSLPAGIAVDDSGNIFIADMEDYVICKVTSSTGILTIVAGTPGSLNAGYGGDGGLATDAALDSPEGVALDDTGNIYIADYLNNVIRKVTVATGIITTVVGNGYGYWHGAGTYTGGYYGDGGPATNAELYGPDALTLDSSGNIYISDYKNNAIRKVTPSTGIITTIAGTGIAGYFGDGGQATAAKIWGPLNISLDIYNNLYLEDGHSIVRKVINSTGIINTIAGNGVNGYSGNGGLATSAELSYAQGVAFDVLGNMFIADVGNNVIRKVTPDTNTVTGTKQLTINNGQLTIFPNPSNGIFILSLSNINCKYNVDIYNVLGEGVHNVTPTLLPQSGSGGSFAYKIDISSQPNGIYFYRVLSENGSLLGSGKIIIEK